MRLDGGKALCADHMLDAAGVLRGDRRIDPEAGQPLRQQAVALVNALGDLLPGRKQRDKAARVHGDIAVFAQVAHGDADARLENSSSFAMSMERTRPLRSLSTRMVSR